MNSRSVALALTLTMIGMAFVPLAAAQVNPYVLPSLSMSPSSGPCGISSTLTGTGFTADEVITISIGSIPVTTVTSDSSGGFSLANPLVGCGASVITITAVGADGGADHATAVFTATNVATATQTAVTQTSGSATVNLPSAGVSVTLSGLGTSTKPITVSSSTLTGPASGVTPQATGSVYVDVRVQVPAGTPSTATANICVTNSAVGSGWSLVYWTGSAWASATNVVVTGTKVCGDIPVSSLSGTNIAAVPPAAVDYTIYYIGGFVVVLIVVVVAGLMLRRRGVKS